MTLRSPPSLGAVNVGLLRDTDNWAGQVSTWYSTNATTVPAWLSYRLDVLISGANQRFTDAANGYRPATGAGVPVQLYLQGGQFDANTNQFVNRGPWRSFTADLAQDRATALRFMLLFDRSSAGDAAVDLLEIDFR